MNEKLNQFIEELTSGYSDDPQESKRELARLDDMCRKASSIIKSGDDAYKKLEKEIAYRNNDPFNVLNKINVNDHVEKKKVKSKKTNTETYLSYLSWAWAWQMLMELYPNSYTSINRSPDGLPYWTDGRTCWVDVSVTIVWDDGIHSALRERTRGEILPIMGGYSNQSIGIDSVTSFDVNTALQRAWTKCIARHGLGFYIYAGEDLPQEEAETKKAEEKKEVKKGEQHKSTEKKTDQQKAVYNQADMAVEFQTLKRKLSNLEVDIHSDNFLNFVYKTANVSTIDGGALLGDLPAMSRVISVMKGIVKAKEDEKAKEQAKNKADTK